jgi:hypothetical protein
MLEKFDKDSKALKKNLLKMCWYMRGGLTYDEAIMLSYEERSLINQIIEENLETTEKTKLPFF